MDNPPRISTPHDSRSALFRPAAGQRSDRKPHADRRMRNAVRKMLRKQNPNTVSGAKTGPPEKQDAPPCNHRAATPRIPQGCRNARATEYSPPSPGNALRHLPPTHLPSLPVFFSFPLILQCPDHRRRQPECTGRGRAFPLSSSFFSFIPLHPLSSPTPARPVALIKGWRLTRTHVQATFHLRRRPSLTNISTRAHGKNPHPPPIRTAQFRNMHGEDPAHVV